MSVVVIVESIVLVVVAVFVTGLLYSYADVHRRVEELEAAGPSAPVGGAGTPAGEVAVERRPARRAVDLQGSTPSGDVVAVAAVGVAHRTLVAFLSSGCTSCARFWEQLGDPGRLRLPPGVRLVVVTKGPDGESPSAVAHLAETAAGSVEPIMSTEAWQDYEVPGSPYFVFVDGPSGLVRGEGTALDWDGVLNLMTLASGDVSLLTGVADRPGKPASDLEREHNIDRVLLDAGIVPGHASLYPTAPPPTAASVASRHVSPAHPEPPRERQ